MIKIAVVGGGPAGSYCVRCLAGNNHYPVIFDHTPPREMPCPRDVFYITIINQKEQIQKQYIKWKDEKWERRPARN